MRVSPVVNSFAAEFFGFLRYFGFPESIHFLETNSPTLPQACRNWDRLLEIFNEFSGAVSKFYRLAGSSSTTKIFLTCYSIYRVVP